MFIHFLSLDVVGPFFVSTIGVYFKFQHIFTPQKVKILLTFPLRSLIARSSSVENIGDKVTYLWIDSGHLCQSSRCPSYASLLGSLSLTKRSGRVLKVPFLPVLSTKHPTFSNVRSHVEWGRGSDTKNTCK